MSVRGKESKSKVPSEIIKLLQKRNIMRFTELKDALRISKPVLSHHLTILHDEKIIEFEKKGREKHYRLSKRLPNTFERQVGLFSIDYTNHLFLSNPSVEPKTPEKIIDEISNNVSAFFLFTLLKSIQTGKNWFKAFDTKEMLWVSEDLLSYTLFGKNVDPEDLQYYVSEGEGIFFNKAQQLSKNEKNEPLIDDLIECLEEKFPTEFEILKQKHDELTSKKN